MSDQAGASGQTELRYDRFRRVTARRLTASVTEKPQVTLQRHARLTSFEGALAEARSRTGSPDVGMTPLLLKLVASTLAAHNRLNGWVEGTVITLFDDVHVGVAVDVEGSLVVPVVRCANRLSVSAIGRQLRSLAASAREGRLRQEDVDGATFTVTGLGSLGVEFFTPIVNPPQLAILGVGGVTEHVILDRGAAVGERRLGLSLTFDHAATDGAEAARLLGHLAVALEDPKDVNWTDEGGAADPDGVLARTSAT